MTFEELHIKGVYKIQLNSFEDERGFFARIFCEKEFLAQGINFSIKQINHSHTIEKGSFRGVHFQYGNYAEWKLVYCIAGSILDFAVDLRKNSPTLYQHVSAELSSQNKILLLLPPGVGHAFQTLQQNTSLIYFHSSFYNTNFEGGVLYNDPKIKLNLPLEIKNISQRDMNHPLLTNDFNGIEYEM